MTEVVLRTENLTRRFGDLLAVDGLSLEVQQGEVFGLLGPNGAGKTTSISMMVGLLAPDAGRTLIRGRPVDAGSVEVRAKVGVCPQEIVVWKELTCLEQLVFVAEMYGIGRRDGRRRAEVLLDRLGLLDRGSSLARTLSGGMQRRLNLALALVHDPEIVVLDEPEAGLDPQSRVLVREYIQSLARHKTVILTTHNMDEAQRLADRVAIVDRGKLLVVDSPEELVQRVGQGDVLEIELPPDADRDAAVRAVSGQVDEATLLNGHALVLRAQGLVARMPALLDALSTAGARPREVRLRENTLEDVFIALTGRRLRQ